MFQLKTPRIICLLFSTLYSVSSLDALSEQPACGKQEFKPISNTKTFSPTFKIINGLDAVENSWPWTVSIRQISKKQILSHSCTGVLIYEDLVLTAAHCVNHLDANQIAVIIGIHNFLFEEPTINNTFYVASRYYHEDFNRISLANDIALLSLVSNITISNTVGLVCLPNNSLSVLNKTLVMVGWGRYGTDTGISMTLKQATLKIINGDEKCIIPKAKVQYNPDMQFCAADERLSDKQSACKGDSGGPLLYEVNSRWFVYGITSYVISTAENYCDNRQPTFFTQIPPYTDWIDYGLNFTRSGRIQDKSSSSRLNECRYLILLTIFLKPVIILFYFE